MMVKEPVAVPDAPLGVLALAVSDVLKLRFAALGNGPVPETDDVEQS